MTDYFIFYNHFYPFSLKIASKGDIFYVLSVKTDKMQGMEINYLRYFMACPARDRSGKNNMIKLETGMLKKCLLAALVLSLAGCGEGPGRTTGTAAGGAATGALIGIIGGPIGVAVGAGIGAGVGAISGANTTPKQVNLGNAPWQGKANGQAAGQHAAREMSPQPLSQQPISQQPLSQQPIKQQPLNP